ncbi:MAG: hypothetical protein Q4C71_03615 [Microbacteriaceae bacterium]|nr:hypothetical protein [Microbacteriaceae bacterium]
MSANSETGAISVMAHDRRDNAITKYQSAAVFGASAVGAISTLLATVVAKAALHGAELTEFLLFWSLLFALYTLPAGFYPEVVRAVGSQHIREKQGHPGKARIIMISAVFGLGITALVGVSAVWWGATQLVSHTWLSIAIICVSVMFYFIGSTMYAASAGRGKWYQHAALLGSEPLIRLLLIVIVYIMAGSLIHMEIAAALPVATWVFFLILSKDARRTLLVRADVSASKFVKNAFFATVASVFIGVLITGFPNILKVSQGHDLIYEQQAQLSIIILAILICRAPIIFPLTAIQSIAIKAFVEKRDSVFRALAKPFILLLMVGLLGGLLAWLIGPFLFRFIYPPRPDEVVIYAAIVDGKTLALLVTASVFMAMLTLTGTLAIARAHHKTYLLGWAVAAAVAVFILFMPLEVMQRVFFSLYAGPFTGVACHVLILLRLRQKMSRCR